MQDQICSAELVTGPCELRTKNCELSADFHSQHSLTYLCMSFPIKTCVICHEEFELHPGKPGFANRCPSCSEPEESPSRKFRLRTTSSAAPLTKSTPPAAARSATSSTAKTARPTL